MWLFLRLCYAQSSLQTPGRGDHVPVSRAAEWLVRTTGSSWSTAPCHTRRTPISWPLQLSLKCLWGPEKLNLGWRQPTLQSEQGRGGSCGGWPLPRLRRALSRVVAESSINSAVFRRSWGSTTDSRQWSTLVLRSLSKYPRIQYLVMQCY